MTLAERRDVETNVYEPAADSALLVEAALEHLADPDLVLDVGTGSGYVGARIAAEWGSRVVGSDVNPHACRRARDAGIPTVRADLVQPFRAESVDAVVCNPPYLPALEPFDGYGKPSVAHDEDWLGLAIVGGSDGRAVIDRLLDDVGRVLRPDGVVLLLVSTVTGIDAVRATALDNGFVCETVATDQYPGETLTVLLLTRE